ncbi:MAG TPA: polysaccharide biosynthesis C-terminal domain-containing protein [Smithellaceae bacterium]|nr:polysaccharide biosynthesis C-terminal domain-containing protein [Smithellaceae bacterium]
MQQKTLYLGYQLLTGKLARTSYLGVVDQAIVSGSNFFTGVLLGRFIAPADFGVFVIIWTTLMITLSTANALICSPMSVIGAQKPAVDISSYWGSLCVLQLFLAACTCFLLMLVGFMLQFISVIDIQFPVFPQLMITFIFCCFFMQFQEFFRRLFIVTHDLRKALQNDVITHAFRIAGLGLLFCTNTLNISNCLTVIGMSLLTGTVLGYSSLRDNIQYTAVNMQSDFRETWTFGKWVLAEMFPYSISVHGYIYITALMIGTKPTAALGASQNILNATNLIILNFSNIITPVAARRYSEGGNRPMLKLMKKAGILAAAPVLGFYLLAMIFAEDMLTFVYSQNYAGYGVLFIICCAYYILSFFNRFIQIILYAKKKPDIGFMAKIASLVVMLILAYPLIHHFGVYGAAVGTVISQIVILTSLSFYLKKNIGHELRT